MSYPFNIKGVYNFDVYPSAILGTGWQKVTVMGIIDYETAVTLVDVAALHAKTYPYISSLGLADDPSTYDYLKVKTSAGIVSVLAIPWINLDTVVTVTSKTITVVIEGANDGDDVNVRAALTQNGFNSLKITIS